MHIYLTARQFDLTDELRAYVERRIVQPVRDHGAEAQVVRLEIQLGVETLRGAQVGCHVLAELKDRESINVKEVASDARTAIDLANERLMPLLTEHRDRMLTLRRHPKKYSLDRMLRALGVRGRRPRTA